MRIGVDAVVVLVWMLFGIVMAFVAATWQSSTPWRFSLRNLLILVSIAALVLG
jgi:hypothetical protein